MQAKNQILKNFKDILQFKTKDEILNYQKANQKFLKHLN